MLAQFWIYNLQRGERKKNHTLTLSYRSVDKVCILAFHRDVRIWYQVQITAFVPERKFNSMFHAT